MYTYLFFNSSTSILGSKVNFVGDKKFISARSGIIEIRLIGALEFGI